VSRDFDLTHQPAQPCAICGKATDASVYIVDRKVPMCPDCSIRFEDYLAEKGGPLPCPPVLYRYRAPSDLKSGEAEDGGLSRFEQFLTTDQVWASNPTQFNDPYDCRQTYDFAASPEEWEKRIDHGIVGALAGYLGAAGKLPLYSEQLEALRTGLKKEAKYNDPAVQAGMGISAQPGGCTGRLTPPVSPDAVARLDPLISGWRLTKFKMLIPLHRLCSLSKSPDRTTQAFLRISRSRSPPP
jgi:hypothetical protein